MKSTTTNKTAPQTHAELAKALGVSRQLITAAIAKGGTPPLGDVAAWKAHFAATGRTGSLPPELRRKIGEARLAILEEQRIALQRENAQKAGELMPTADAIREAGEAMAAVFSEFERFAREAPPSLAGLDAVSIFKRIEAWVESIRKTLTEKFNEVGK